MTDIKKYNQHSTEDFLQAHHLPEVPYIPVNAPPMQVYFNFYNETFSTVDWRYLSEMVNIQMNVAIMKETMQSSMTLIGLMASMSIQGPSIVAVMAFLGIFNIEIASSTVKSNFSTYVNAAIQPTTSFDATNLQTNNFKTIDYYLRPIKASEAGTFQRNYLTSKWLFNSVGIFLGTILLFDELRKRLPATDVKNPMYQYQMEVAFNLSNFVFHESMSYPMAYIRSYANWMAGPMLQFNYTRCIQERGQHQNIKYYVKPVPDANKNIHNVLFRNSFPRLHTHYTTIVNNQTAMKFRQLFYSQFSNFRTNVAFADSLRRTAIKPEDFTEYIFDYDTSTLPDTFKRISFDTLPLLLNALEKADTGVAINNEIISLYSEIVKTAKIIFPMFSEYMRDIRIYNSCALKSDYPLGLFNQGVPKQSTKITDVVSLLTPSKTASVNVGDIIHHGFKMTDQQYSLLAPIFGSAYDMGNLNAGFFKGLFYSGVTANVQLRQSSIEKLYVSKLNKIIDDLVSTYDWMAALQEQVQPQQDWNALLNFAYKQGGSMDCVADYLQIPNILSNHLDDWKRGVFEKN